jgi:hypothetical protein
VCVRACVSVLYLATYLAASDRVSKERDDTTYKTHVCHQQHKARENVHILSVRRNTQGLTTTSGRGQNRGENAKEKERGPYPTAIQTEVSSAHMDQSITTSGRAQDRGHGEDAKEKGTHQIVIECETVQMGELGTTKGRFEELGGTGQQGLDVLDQRIILDRQLGRGLNGEQQTPQLEQRQGSQ